VDLAVAGAVAGVTGAGAATTAGAADGVTGAGAVTTAGATAGGAGADVESAADAAAGVVGVGVDTAAGVAAAGGGAGVTGGDGASVAAGAGAADPGAVATAAGEDEVDDEVVDCCDEALESDAGGGTASCLVVAGLTEPGTCALTIELTNSAQVNAKMKRGRRWLMMSSRIAAAVHFDYYFEKLAP